MESLSLRHITVSKKAGIDSDVQEGYVSKAMIDSVSKDGKFDFVCVSGPPKQVEAVAGAKGLGGWTQGSMGGILAQLGYTKDNVRKF